MGTDASMAVCVVYSPEPRRIVEQTLHLPPGAQVRSVLEAAPLPAPWRAMALQDGFVGIWGQRVDLDQVLLDGDRVEIYRALQADPNSSRRKRLQTQPNTKKRRAQG